MFKWSPIGSSGLATCTAAMRSAAPSKLTRAEVEVTTPSRHARTMPSVTPSLSPKSSALTIRTRRCRLIRPSTSKCVGIRSAVVERLLSPDSFADAKDVSSAAVYINWCRIEQNVNSRCEPTETAMSANEATYTRLGDGQFSAPAPAFACCFCLLLRTASPVVPGGRRCFKALSAAHKPSNAPATTSEGQWLFVSTRDQPARTAKPYYNQLCFGY